MPLYIASSGEAYKVARILGNNKVKNFLGSLGIIVGTDIKIISKISGNIIVNVKDTRIALGKDISSKILV